MFSLKYFLAAGLCFSAVTSYADNCYLFDYTNVKVTGSQMRDDSWSLDSEGVDSRNVIVTGITYPINSLIENHRPQVIRSTDDKGTLSINSFPKLDLSGESAPDGLPLPEVTIKFVGLKHNNVAISTITPSQCLVTFLPNKCSVLHVSGEINIPNENSDPVIVKPISCEMTYLHTNPF